MGGIGHAGFRMQSLSVIQYGQGAQTGESG
jgi:hypothetical protein